MNNNIFMRVIHINKKNYDILQENCIIPIPYDIRIGSYINKESYDFLTSEIKNLLNVSPDFELRSGEEDKNNPILILPTAFKHNEIVKELIK